MKKFVFALGVTTCLVDVSLVYAKDSTAGDERRWIPRNLTWVSRREDPFFIPFKPKEFPRHLFTKPSVRRALRSWPLAKQRRFPGFMKRPAVSRPSLQRPRPFLARPRKKLVFNLVPPQMTFLRRAPSTPTQPSASLQSLVAALYRPLPQAHLNKQAPTQPSASLKDLVDALAQSPQVKRVALAISSESKPTFFPDSQKLSARHSSGKSVSVVSALLEKSVLPQDRSLEAVPLTVRPIEMRQALSSPVKEAVLAAALDNKDFFHEELPRALHKPPHALLDQIVPNGAGLVDDSYSPKELHLGKNLEDGAKDAPVFAPRQEKLANRLEEKALHQDEEVLHVPVDQRAALLHPVIVDRVNAAPHHDDLGLGKPLEDNAELVPPLLHQQLELNPLVEENALQQARVVPHVLADQRDELLLPVHQEEDLGLEDLFEENALHQDEGVLHVPVDQRAALLHPVIVDRVNAAHHHDDLGLGNIVEDAVNVALPLVHQEEDLGLDKFFEENALHQDEVVLHDPVDQRDEFLPPVVGTPLDNAQELLHSEFAYYRALQMAKLIRQPTLRVSASFGRTPAIETIGEPAVLQIAQLIERHHRQRVAITPPLQDGGLQPLSHNLLADVQPERESSHVLIDLTHFGIPGGTAAIDLKSLKRAARTLSLDSIGSKKTGSLVLSSGTRRAPQEVYPLNVTLFSPDGQEKSFVVSLNSKSLRAVATLVGAPLALETTGFTQTALLVPQTTLPSQAQRALVQQLASLMQSALMSENSVDSTVGVKVTSSSPVSLVVTDFTAPFQGLESSVDGLPQSLSLPGLRLRTPLQNKFSEALISASRIETPQKAVSIPSALNSLFPDDVAPVSVAPSSTVIAQDPVDLTHALTLPVQETLPQIITPSLELKSQDEGVSLTVAPSYEVRTARLNRQMHRKLLPPQAYPVVSDVLSAAKNLGVPQVSDVSKTLGVSLERLPSDALSTVVVPHAQSLELVPHAQSLELVPTQSTALGLRAPQTGRGSSMSITVDLATFGIKHPGAPRQVTLSVDPASVIKTTHRAPVSLGTTVSPQEGTLVLSSKTHTDQAIYTFNITISALNVPSQTVTVSLDSASFQDAMALMNAPLALETTESTQTGSLVALRGVQSQPSLLSRILKHTARGVSNVVPTSTSGPWIGKILSKLPEPLRQAVITSTSLVGSRAVSVSNPSSALIVSTVQPSLAHQVEDVLVIPTARTYPVTSDLLRAAHDLGVSPFVASVLTRLSSPLPLPQEFVGSPAKQLISDSNTPLTLDLATLGLDVLPYGTLSVTPDSLRQATLNTDTDDNDGYTVEVTLTGLDGEHISLPISLPPESLQELTTLMSSPPSQFIPRALFTSEEEQREEQDDDRVSENTFPPLLPLALDSLFEEDDWLQDHTEDDSFKLRLPESPLPVSRSQMLRKERNSVGTPIFGPREKRDDTHSTTPLREIFSANNSTPVSYPKTPSRKASPLSTAESPILEQPKTPPSYTGSPILEQPKTPPSNTGSPILSPPQTPEYYARSPLSPSVSPSTLVELRRALVTFFKLNGLEAHLSSKDLGHSASQQRPSSKNTSISRASQTPLSRKSLQKLVAPLSDQGSPILSQPKTPPSYVGSPIGEMPPTPPSDKGSPILSQPQTPPSYVGSPIGEMPPTPPSDKGSPIGEMPPTPPSYVGSPILAQPKTPPSEARRTPRSPTKQPSVERSPSQRKAAIGKENKLNRSGTANKIVHKAEPSPKKSAARALKKTVTPTVLPSSPKKKAVTPTALSSQPGATLIDSRK